MLFRTNRRQLLGGALGGIFTLAARHQQQHLFAAVQNAKPAKRCLVLWMAGGPSQLETIDPKPGVVTGGPTQIIKTCVPGIEIAEHLPQIAARMDRLSLIRSLTSPEGDHDRGEYFLHTGYPQVQAFARPTLGSIVSHQTEPADFPKFVSIGAQGLGPAYMGPDHAPFAIEDPLATVQLIKGLRRDRSSLQRLDQFNQQFARQHQASELDRQQSVLKRIERMLTTPFVTALDIERGPATDRERYGESEFGRSCLVARRLLEAGVSFVEVTLGGWDTHEDNFTNVARLCGELDRPWATLIDDLQASGLWEETVVVWMGEFGRTPQINVTTGRDHFPKVTPVAIGGGGIREGLVVGKTNKLGLDIEESPVTVPDLLATILQAMEIDPGHVFTTQFGATAPATDNGKPIASLIG